MRRFFSRAIAAILLLQPAFAFAAFDTPADLFAAMMRDPSPRTFSGEVHGSFDTGTDGTMYVSFWTNGAQEGNDVANGKARMQGTLDFAFPSSNITVRTKVSLLYVDHTVFIRLDGFEGAYDDELMLGKFNILLKQWIRIPIDRKTIVQLRKQTMDFTPLNELFDLQRTQTRSGNTYVLTLKPEIVQSFLSGMTGGGSVPAPEAPMTLKVDMSSQDRFQASSFSVAIANDRLTLKGEGKMARSAAPLSIAAPKDSVSVEELEAWAEQLSGASPPSLLDDMTDLPSVLEDLVPSEDASQPVDEWQEPEEPTWGWEEEGEVWEEEEGTGCTLLEIQRRQCAGARPSRREK